MFLLIVTVLFIVAGIFVSKKYGNEIKNYAITQVNRQLETKIAVEKINVSFFSHFPYLSVVFNNVAAMSGHDFDPLGFENVDTDTLFTAQKIYLQFNVFDILFGKYRIRRIHAANGSLNMLVDRQGKTNFRMFKQKKAAESGSRGFELEAVKLNGFDILFINRAKNITARAVLNDILFKGKFSGKNFSLGTIVSMDLLDFTREGVKYADHFGISARVIFQVRDSLATVEKGELNVNNLRMNIGGNFTLGSVSQMNLSLQSRGFDLHALQTSLPEPQRELIPVDLYGHGDIAFRINGPFSRIEVPDIKAVYLFNINRAKYNKRSFQNIKLKGRFSNGGQRNPVSTTILVEQYSIDDFNTSLNGTFLIKNLVQPYIRLTMKGDASAGAINEFFESDVASGFTGMLHPDFSLQTQLKGWKIENATKLLSTGLNGKMGVEDFGLTLNGKYAFSDVNGNIEFSGDTWYPILDLTSGLSHLELKLKMEHVFSYLMNTNSSLWISGDVNANRIDITPFIKSDDDGGSNGMFLFPDRVHARISVSMDTLTSGRFFAGKSDTYLQYKPGVFSFTSVHMKSMDGTIRGEGVIKQDRDKNLFLSTQSEVAHLNINTMFNSLNNFNQDFIVAGNLKGYLSGNIDFATSFDSLLNMNSKNTEADARIVINSGELINFEPIEKLSSFVELDELKHINFSRLENHIIIKDQTVFIPQMDIQSSAFNITVSGEHHFDNHFDYKLKVNLSDILAGKARHAKKENEAFGVIEPDSRRTNLYLTIAGTPDDFKIKYDKKEAIVNIKQDMKEEKGRLKTILNEEFGWFKKDSALEKRQTKQDDKFIIEWDQDTTPGSNVNIDKPTKKNEKRKFKIEWDEDDK